MKYKSIYKKMKKEIYNVEIVFFLNLIMFIAYVAPSSNVMSSNNSRNNRNDKPILKNRCMADAL